MSSHVKPWFANVAQQLIVAALLVCSLTTPPRAQAQRIGLSSSAEPGDSSDNNTKLTLSELSSLTTAFADRYMTYVVTATDQIERNNPNAEQRRRAHQVKLVQTSAVYDIVTNADPFTQLLDLTLVVSLQARKWIDDDRAEAWFGSRGRPLVLAARQAREDIWKLAAKVMRPDQLEQLDAIILGWHRDHPEVEIVSWVRFDEVAASRGKSIVAEVTSGGGFLAPVGEATKAVDEARLLGERAFYMSKRWPFLLSWQARAAVDETLSSPALNALQTQAPVLVESIDRITRSIDRLPADLANERKQLEAAFDKTQPKVQATLAQSNQLVRDADVLAGSVHKLSGSLTELLARLEQTSVALNQSVKTVDEVFIKPGAGKAADTNAKPFDIQAYAHTAEQTTLALQQASTLLGEVRTTLDSPQLMTMLERPMTVATVLPRFDRQAFLAIGGVVSVGLFVGFVVSLVFFTVAASGLICHEMQIRIR